MLEPALGRSCTLDAIIPLQLPKLREILEVLHSLNTSLLQLLIKNFLCMDELKLCIIELIPQSDCLFSNLQSDITCLLELVLELSGTPLTSIRRCSELRHHPRIILSLHY